MKYCCIFDPIKPIKKIKMFTIVFITEDKKKSLQIMKKCLKNNISFEFLNGTEFYFTIYDKDDFENKMKYLGCEIISEDNKVN